jgi:PAS domain S-box-containing protein
MGIRKKILVVIFITIIPLFLVVFFVFSNNILQKFAAIEDTNAKENLNRAVAAIKNNIYDMQTVVGGWSNWDDAYTYAVTPTQTFYDANLINATYVKNEINMLLFINNDGKIISGRNLDIITGQQSPLPPDLFPYMQKGSKLTDFTKSNDPISGLIMVNKQPLLIATAPILTGHATGPSHGTIIFARYLNTSVINKIDNTIHENIIVYPYQEQLPPDFAQAKAHLSTVHTIYINPLSAKQIAGYSIYYDILGKPALIVKMTLPRPIYEEGQKSIYSFNILFGSIAFLFIISMIILLNKAVISRILALYTAVLKITQSKDIQKNRLTLSGNDEISKLGAEINSTLDSLNQAIIGQQKGEEEFRNTADIIPAMIWVANAEGNCTYVNKYWLEFTGRSEEQELGNGWQESIHPEEKDVYILEYKTAIENKTSYKKEVRLKRADGQYRWMLTQFIPNKTPDGTVIGYLGAGADITEVKESSEKIEQANKEFLNRELAMSELKKENEELEKKLEKVRA